MIELKDVSVTFRQKEVPIPAVRNVNLTVNDGEIFGIVGPSGAGKSTLVRVINLLQPPTRGRVVIDGEDITELKGAALRSVRLKIGMIFQHFNLISRATAAENIAFALKADRVPKKEIEKRVAGLLEQVGLSDRAGAYPASLSGGQKQRVAIARALANRPRILLCDEATSALDPENTEEILRILREINRKEHITIVFITHQMEVAKKLFDRMGVMIGGRIVEVNDTYRMFTEPWEKTTADLVARTLDIGLPESFVPGPDEELLRLFYVGEKANEPVISLLSKRYDVYAEIIHGKIEYIQQKPLGVLLIRLSGEAGERERAREFLKSQVFRVEPVVLKGGDGDGGDL